MGFGSRTVAEYDVGFNIDLGKVTGDLGAVGETFARTTGKMSDDAIRLSVAQDKLNKAIKRSGPESTAAKTALLNYRREVGALQHTQTTTAVATGRHVSALRQEERELVRAGRGALAASGIFRGLGRAVAFSSGTFLGGAGLIFAIKEATKVAAEQQTQEAQLATALNNRGIAIDGVRGKVNELIASNAKLGFGELDTTKALTLAATTTGSLAGATRLLSVAQNVARARGTDLFTSTSLLTRAFVGAGRGLKALGIEVVAGTKGYAALDAVQAKYAGRAVAYANGPAGAYARLNAELERTKVTIGRELLPAELQIATAVSDWLGKTKNQETIQRDLNQAVKVGSAVAHELGVVLKFVSEHGDAVKNVLEVLLALKVASTVSGWATAVNLFARSLVRTTGAAEGAAAAGGIASAETAIANAGGAAAVADTNVARLSRSLSGLGAITIAPIVIPIEMSLIGKERDWLTKHAGILGGVGKALLDIGTADLGGNPITDLTGIGGGGGDEKSPPRPHTGYAGNSPNALTSLPSDGTFTGKQGLAHARPTSLQGRFNIAAYHLAQAGNDQNAREAALNDELAIVNKQIAKEKNLAKKTAFINERNGIRDQIQQIADDRNQKAADAARKRKEARDRAAKAAEARRYGGATDALQRLSARARLQGGRGQFEAERQTLLSEESDLEKYVKDAALSVDHRRQLQRRLDQVRQQLDDLRRKEQSIAAAKAARPLLLIQRAEARAALTERTDDDLRAFRAEETLVKRRLAAIARIKHLTNQQIQNQTALLQQKKSVQDQIKQILGENASSGSALARELHDAVAGLAQYAPNVQAALGTNVTVNQHFPHPPTNDGFREAIYARHALQAAFD